MSLKLTRNFRIVLQQKFSIFTTEEAAVSLFYPERLIFFAVIESLSLRRSVINWTQEMEYDKLNRGMTSMLFRRNLLTPVGTGS